MNSKVIWYNNCLLAVTMNITTCWNMTPCPLINMYQCFERTCFYINIHKPHYNSGSVCLTIGPQHLPNQVLHRVQYSANPLSFRHLIISLRLCTSCLHLLHCFPVTSIFSSLSPWGHAVAQLIEALHYNLEGSGFDSWWCHWLFSLP